MWQYIVPAIATVLVAVIEAIAYKDRKHTRQMTEEMARLATQRAEESRLSMQMADATLQLSIVSANALSGGHNNGNVAIAKDAAEKAQAEYQKFLQKTTAEAMNKPVLS